MTTIQIIDIESTIYLCTGLGDTNYANFCNCGRVLDRRFEELGATRFYPSSWADDAVGYNNEDLICMQLF